MHSLTSFAMPLHPEKIQLPRNDLDAFKQEALALPFCSRVAAQAAARIDHAVPRHRVRARGHCRTHEARAFTLIVSRTDAARRHDSLCHLAIGDHTPNWHSAHEFPHAIVKQLEIRISQPCHIGYSAKT